MTDRLLVLLSGEVVGVLQRDDSGEDPTFAYLDDYVTHGTVALSAQLPIRRGEYPARKV